jgi:arylsulfatase A
MTGGPNTPLAIRQGPWKYIQPGPRSGNAALLYNLADDLGEQKNVAAQHPDKVKELAALLDQVRKATSTRPQ